MKTVYVVAAIAVVAVGSYFVYTAYESKRKKEEFTYFVGEASTIGNKVETNPVVTANIMRASIVTRAERAAEPLRGDVRVTDYTSEYDSGVGRL